MLVSIFLQVKKGAPRVPFFHVQSVRQDKSTWTTFLVSKKGAANHVRR